MLSPDAIFIILQFFFKNSALKKSSGVEIKFNCCLLANFFNSKNCWWVNSNFFNLSKEGWSELTKSLVIKVWNFTASTPESAAALINFFAILKFP